MPSRRQFRIAALPPAAPPTVPALDTPEGPAVRALHGRPRHAKRAGRAAQVHHRPMPVRDRDPLMTTCPFDAHPVRRPPVYDCRCAWQLGTIERL